MYLMEKYMKNSPIPSAIKKVLPAVVSIAVSKLLPVFEAPFAPQPRGGMPFGGPVPFGFDNFMMIPKGKKKVKVGGGSGFIADSWAFASGVACLAGSRLNHRRMAWGLESDNPLQTHLDSDRTHDGVRAMVGMVEHCHARKHSQPRFDAAGVCVTIWIHRTKSLLYCWWRLYPLGLCADPCWTVVPDPVSESGNPVGRYPDGTALS